MVPRWAIWWRMKSSIRRSDPRSSRSWRQILTTLIRGWNPWVTGGTRSAVSSILSHPIPRTCWGSPGAHCWRRKIVERLPMGGSANALVSRLCTVCRIPEGIQCPSSMRTGAVRSISGPLQEEKADWIMHKPCSEPLPTRSCVFSGGHAADRLCPLGYRIGKPGAYPFVQPLSPADQLHCTGDVLMRLLDEQGIRWELRKSGG